MVSDVSGNPTCSLAEWLEYLHSDCFCCMWYVLCLEILYSHWVSAIFLQKMAVFLLSLHSDWPSGLEEASIFQIVL